MSNPGFTTAQLTPELLQQWQQQIDLQRRQAMAQSLMQSNADPQTPYAGLSNAGGDLAGAYAIKAMQDKMKAQTDPIFGMKDQMGVSLSGTPPGLFSRIGSMFGLGG